MNSALLYQKQQHQTNQQLDLNTEKTGIRMVQSGKVYRQLFEAQVQLSEAYDKVKEKQRENPAQVRVRDEGIPLVREGRNARGTGFLDEESEMWLHAPSTDQYVNNPVFYKYQHAENKNKLTKNKKRHEREDVGALPDIVVPSSEGSNIEARVELSRKKKHNEFWEDMIQEIALVNLNLEPKIKKNGKEVLNQLALNDQSLEELLAFILKSEEVIQQETCHIFEEYKAKLLTFTEIRKEFIDSMDKNFLEIEAERVSRIRAIFNKYAEKLFLISFLSKPDIEKLFDNEIQQLNNQILLNKTCYTQLYVKLITGDIERERNQINLIESREAEWRQHALDRHVIKLEEFVENLSMIKPENVDSKLEDELCQEQMSINKNRIGLVEALNTFKPPESTKTAVYKWYESIRDHCKHIDEVNTNYVTKLRTSNEEANQKIINKMEQTLKCLIDSRITAVEESKEVLEKRLLPIWSRKQKGIEEFIERIEQEFEELGQLVEREVNAMFKYLQGAGHIWDMHEIGLVKKERGLQELMQDSRKDHDSDNQKREEKLDSMLDQMREASVEKDLKRLLSNVTMQLDSIKRGYQTFGEAQTELVKQYPGMVMAELNKYENLILTYFSVQRTNNVIEEEDEVVDNMSQMTEEISGTTNRESVVPATQTISSLKQSMTELDTVKQQQQKPKHRRVIKDEITTDRGTKFYIYERVSSISNQANNTTESQLMTSEATERSNADIVSMKSLATIKDSQTQNDSELPNDILGFDEVVPNTRSDFLETVQTANYLKHATLSLDLLRSAKNQVRINFLNHLETWFDEGSLRASTIVAAKINEIEKELELRLHLHEPRHKRAEMDVHNVRASEIILHDERVERHVAGCDEAVKKLMINFETMQAKLGEMSTTNKTDVFNLEVAFLNATKSKILVGLHEQLNKQKDRYMDSVKAELRGFRTELDETLSFLRSSNVKFRVSFNPFSSGGNFSTEEAEVQKKRLEKIASMLDNSETTLLKELEKIEKRYMDEAVKVIVQFQEKFKFHLVDLQFIEKISRWLNETQIKIKTQVNGSNLQAKELSERIREFERRVDCCARPNLDKMQVKPADLLALIDELNVKIYERAFYLRCFKDEEAVPNKYVEMFKVDVDARKAVVAQGNLASSIAGSANRNNREREHTFTGDHTQSSNSMSKKTSAAVRTPNSAAVLNLKSNSKVNSEDPALAIMKTILVNQQGQKDLEFTATKSESSMHATSARQSSKSKSRIEKEKLAKAKLTRIIRFSPNFGDMTAMLLDDDNQQSFISNNVNTTDKKKHKTSILNVDPKTKPKPTVTFNKQLNYSTDKNTTSNYRNSSKISFMSSRHGFNNKDKFLPDDEEEDEEAEQAKKQMKKKRGFVKPQKQTHFDEKLLSVAQVEKIMSQRRAKTRDEMYLYYCVFGEHADPGNDFKANINNILRDTLEGILSNSEMFYRELQQQNRHPTRPQSIKESYVDFADTMIIKLKSYMAQCDTYHNQCLLEFKDCLAKYEVICATVPELVAKEVFTRSADVIMREFRDVKSRNLENLSKLDVEKVTNESMLKPNLGHPNMQNKLDQLNRKETERQKMHQRAIDAYVEKLSSLIGHTSNTFIAEMSTFNELLLLKFDEILTEDDVLRPDTVAAKHPTSELIRRQKAGLPLEDGEPKPLIKRERGSWIGIQTYDFLNDAHITRPMSGASIKTLKTTLAHKTASDFTHEYHTKFRANLEEYFNYLKTTETELNYKTNKWAQYWSDSINQIKELYV